MFSIHYYYYKMKDWMVIEHNTGFRYLISAKGFHFLKLIREYCRQKSIDSIQEVDALLSISDDPEFGQFVSFLDQIGFLSTENSAASDKEMVSSDEHNHDYSRNDDLYKQLQIEAYYDYRPGQVQMEIESLCNFNCKYCVRGCSVPYDLNKMLTINDYKTLFDEFDELGISQVTFSGGEPFLRKDINDILMLTTEYGFKVNIFSNASLITQSNIDVLKKIRFVGLQIGLYGNKEDYPAFTGVDAFDDVWNAINLLKMNGISFLLSCPITKLNRSSFSFFKSLEDTFRINYNYRISPPKKNLPRDASTDFALDIDDEFLNDVFKPSKPIEIDPNEDSKCVIGHNFVCIDIEGNVFPCYTYPVPIGNLHDSNLSNIWFNNPDMDRLRKINFSDVFVKCRSCECQPYCIRCMAYNLIFTGSEEKLNNYTCKLGMFETELHKRKAMSGK